MKTVETLSQRLVRNLETVRTARGMDAETFERESGVSLQLLSLWRTGKNGATLATVQRTGERLGIDPGALLSASPSEVLKDESRNGGPS